jgi:hypothetical protein
MPILQTCKIDHAALFFTMLVGLTLLVYGACIYFPCGLTLGAHCFCDCSVLAKFPVMAVFMQIASRLSRLVSQIVNVAEGTQDTVAHTQERENANT